MGLDLDARRADNQHGEAFVAGRLAQAVDDNLGVEWQANHAAIVAGNLGRAQ